jgi:hypothetical protein
MAYCPGEKPSLSVSRACAEFKATNRSLDVTSAEFGARSAKELFSRTQIHEHFAY